MRILVLGGTVFLGRHIVDALLARGHDVTLFHRGTHGAHLFPHVARVLGDRAADLDRLPSDARWDAVVDTSGYLPGIVGANARALAARVRAYAFISSVSVYDLDAQRIDEASRTLALAPGAPADEVTPATYGPLKRACEDEVVRVVGPDRALIVRPGLIVGPWDPTDRFTAWPVRFARGGDVAVPDDLEAPVQWIDVRDLALFVVESLERNAHGVVNTVGPEHELRLGAFFEACARVAGVPSRLVPVASDVLDAHGVGEWIDMPLWVRARNGFDGITRVDGSRARAMGLRLRPLEGTLADTLRWARDERGDAPFAAGLDAEREHALLSTAG